MSHLAPLAVPAEVKEQQANENFSRVFRLTDGILPTQVTFEQALPFEDKTKVTCQFALPGQDARLCVHGVVTDDARAITFVAPDQDATQRIVAYTEERNSTP